MSTPQEYLDSLNNFEAHLQNISPNDFHLGRVKQALDMLGHPQENLNVIHVAGTKGKGSTCMMLASILANAGKKVGLFTSPHLHRLNERIRILDQSNLHAPDDFPGSITDEELERILSQVRPVIASIENKGSFITYFEALTIIAAVYFKEQHVDWLVLETGLGGRLDATNVFDSSIAIITPISLDHVRILGNTLKQIALEKAGIIKSSHQHVIVAPQEDEAMAAIRSACHEFGIKPTIVHPMQYKQMALALKGDHQLTNAACAFEAINILKQKGVSISDEAIVEGFKRVRWQGRFEIIKDHPIVIVDGAHNPASAEALAKTMRDEYHQKKVTLILGLSLDKDIEAVCEPLKLISHEIILTKAKHPRAHHFTKEEAQKIFAGKNFKITQNVKEALKVALSETKKDDVILVTGSLFIVAEVRECINSKV